jgi:hypothetical protein
MHREIIYSKFWHHFNMQENTILSTLDIQIEQVILLHSKSNGTMFQTSKEPLHRTWRKNSTIFIHVYEMPLKEHLVF